MKAKSLPVSAGKPEIVLDISRLLSRVLHSTPTGVDRVEMAYAVELLRMAPERLSFAAVHPIGRYGRVPNLVARRFLDLTRADWENGSGVGSREIRRLFGVLRVLWEMRPRAIPRASRPRILLQSSPHHLHDEKSIGAILRRERAKFVCLVHDLIPIEYPEYARPNGDERHRQRMATIARFASGAISNSEATRRSLLHHLELRGKTIPVRVAHLGLDPRDGSGSLPASLTGRTYFVCIGTIEPRKNHLLLLNVWRRIAERADGQTPLLVLIGRRGWENEQVIDMLERCPALQSCVIELGRTTDDEMHGILAGACALLLPSFAEGYGMTVPEALASGVPVICSDLPALREAGGDVPDYLDPLDGPAWIDAVRDYALPASPSRRAQIARIARWAAPAWPQHVRSALEFAEAVTHG